MTSSATNSTGAAPPPGGFELDLVPGATALEKDLAWFKVVFGCAFMAIGVATMGRFYYVRNIFEIKARSPYLALLSGLSLMGILGLTTYLAGFTLNSKLTVDVYKVYIGFYFCAFALSASLWSRITRLGLAYYPRLRRKLPLLMSERLLVCLSILVGLAGTAFPLHKMHTINGPWAWVIFVKHQDHQLLVCQRVLLAFTLFLVPIVWRVDDIFRISKELLLVIVLLAMQTIGNTLTERYAGTTANHWINEANVLFVAGIALFSLIVIDPIRRLAFNPMSKSYPAVARASTRKHSRVFRSSLKQTMSNLTEPGSQREDQDTQSTSAKDVAAPKRCAWTYERLAVVPELAAAFRAFAFRALCQESVLFLEEIVKYRAGDFSMCSSDDRRQKKAFLAIVARFIVDGSVDEVNISFEDKKEITELSRNDGERFEMLEEDNKRAVFGEAYIEIRHMLETNLLHRFTMSQEFKNQEGGIPAPAPPTHARRRRPRVSTIDDLNDDDLNAVQAARRLSSARWAVSQLSPKNLSAV